jgi:hypothetical protein
MNQQRFNTYTSLTWLTYLYKKYMSIHTYISMECNSDITAEWKAKVFQILTYT